MGLYDTFIGKFKCPRCNYQQMEGYQTKALENCLDKYGVGDKIRSEMKLKDAKLPVYTSNTHKCKRGWRHCWIDAYVIIKNGRYIALKVDKVSEWQIMKVTKITDDHIELTNKTGNPIHYVSTKTDKRCYCQ